MPRNKKTTSSSTKKRLDKEQQNHEEEKSASSENVNDTSSKLDEKTTHSDDQVGKSDLSNKLASYSQRLFNLQLRLNQAKHDNTEQAIEEYEQLEYKPKPFFNHKNVIEKAMEIPNVTLEESEYFEKKRKRSQKKKPEGWEALNSDSLYKLHKKRIKETISQQAIEEYKSAERDSETNLLAYGSSLGKDISDENKEIMANELKQKIEKSKANYSRERKQNDDETVLYVNDTNKRFTKSLSKAYDKYTEDIRGNLERGTAM
ncbi:hypothetical protein C9374_000537 [Naegleria lovaniensis]|uniref:Pre-mRNA-splicing factor SYF2 n=1 Tax=Naegleria lovaniensis TaxID=51637 RepID=A0AA88KNB6_NAELO|nr:uncharacterized protein C9374_000537 [Naegleria lovaniensis]KAG2388373.1 hypothetical protein C9374_000537 [Naegleria lovaniensis]